MTRTFLLTLNVDDTSPMSLTELSEDIHDELETKFDVVGVRAWDQQAAPTSPTIQLGQPPVV